jgi:hypothetical protein
VSLRRFFPGFFDLRLGYHLLEWCSGIRPDPLYPRADAHNTLGPPEPTTTGPEPNSTQKSSLLGEDCPTYMLRSSTINFRCGTKPNSSKRLVLLALLSCVYLLYIIFSRNKCVVQINQQYFFSKQTCYENQHKMRQTEPYFDIGTKCQKYQAHFEHPFHIGITLNPFN